MEGKGFGIFPPKSPKMECDIKDQSDVKPKLEAEFKIKIEPIEEFDSGMEIITKMNVPARSEIKNENIDIHPFKKPKIETDVKPKVEADIKIKTEPIEEFNRSIEIITKMNVPANGEIQNEKIEPKIEMDIKPKIEADFKAKIEPIDDIIRGMEIIGNMNIRSQVSIMSDFCRLTPIEGKGFGIVASTFIKKGTMILKEDAQMPLLDAPDLEDVTEAVQESWMNWIKKILDLFNKMKNSDQKEYLELYNQFEYVPESDISQWQERVGISYENCVNLWLLKVIKKMEDDKEKAEKIFKIVGIYYSNYLNDGLKIKRARFNHSCRPNTFQQPRTNEIRVVSNIEPGQEITINYTEREKLFCDMLSKETRQEFLPDFNVTNCFCNLCKEDTSNKTIIGSKMDELIAELELLASVAPKVVNFQSWKHLFSVDPKYENDLFTPEKCRRHVDLCKEIYKLGKERKDPKYSLFTILNNGWIAAHFGILMVWRGPKKQMAEGFKKDCINFCKVFEKVGNGILLGKQLVKPEEWRERHQDYDKFLEDFGVKLS